MTKSKFRNRNSSQVEFYFTDSKLFLIEGLPHTVRSTFIIAPDKKIQCIMTYPLYTGRNFNEIIRVIDSLQLAPSHGLVQCWETACVRLTESRFRRESCLFHKAKSGEFQTHFEAAFQYAIISQNLLIIFALFINNLTSTEEPFFTTGLATPQNWQRGSRAMILPNVSDEEAKERFGEDAIEINKKFPYIKMTAVPGWQFTKNKSDTVRSTVYLTSTWCGRKWTFLRIFERAVGNQFQADQSRTASTRNPSNKVKLVVWQAERLIIWAFENRNEGENN